MFSHYISSHLKVQISKYKVGFLRVYTTFEFKELNPRDTKNKLILTGAFLKILEDKHYFK